MSFPPDVSSGRSRTAQSMGLFQLNKKYPDVNVTVTVKITPKMFSTLCVLLWTAGVSTVAVVVSDGAKQTAVDAVYPAPLQELPQQNPICVAHLS